MLVDVLLAAAASVLSCWVGPQTLLFSLYSLLIFSSQASGSYSSESSYLPVMFDIVLLGVVWEGMLVVRGEVGEVGKLIVWSCGVVVGSTVVLLEWSAGRRDCSGEGGGGYL